MSLSRRSFVLTLAGAFAGASAAQAAWALGPDREAERRALIAHMQHKTLGFHVLDVAGRLWDEARLPRRHFERVRQALSDVDLSRGFRSIQDLPDDRSLRLSQIAEDASKDLRVQLALLRLARKAPETLDGQAALLDHLMVDLLGLDLPRIRAHVADYPPGLLVLFGPVREHLELAGIVLHEPFTRFLELVHGYKAKALFAESSDPLSTFLPAMLEPDTKVVAIVGHGSWTTFAISGFAVGPLIFAELCGRAARHPRRFLTRLAEGHLGKLLGTEYMRHYLKEEDLAKLVSQLHPNGMIAPKERLVRYTCGGERYDVDGKLLMSLVPRELRQKLDVVGTHFGVKEPGDVEAVIEPLRAFLADKSVRVTAEPAFGTSLVARPEDSHGYEGITWLADFLEDPVPAFRPPAGFVTAAPPYAP